MIVLSADRPAELREVGAGQTIDQIKLYGGAVRWFFEVGNHDATRERERWIRALACRAVAAATGERPGPVHLNWALREPLVTPGAAAPLTRRAAAAGGRGCASSVRAAAPVALAELVGGPRRGVIVAGRDDAGLAPRDPGARRGRRLSAARRPALGRAPRRRRDRPLRPAAARRRFAAAHAPEVVIRVGDLPTSKPLREWLAGLDGARQMLVDPHGGWQDPAAVVDTVLRAEPACARAPPRRRAGLAAPGVRPTPARPPPRRGARRRAHRAERRPRARDARLPRRARPCSSPRRSPVPPGQTAPLRPVIALHGKGQDAAGVMAGGVEDGFAQAVAAGIPPFAVVAVDGGGGYWHKRASGEDAGAMVLDELIPMLGEQGLDTSRVGFLGWSMGGYGALLLGPGLAPRGRRRSARSARRCGRPRARRRRVRSTAPTTTPPTASGAYPISGSIPIRIDCGDSDPFYSATKQFIAQLPSPPSGGFSPGGHDGAFWSSQLPAEIAWMAPILVA